MTSLQMEPPPPPPPPPRRSVSTSCDLHPDETFTGFCTACLRERLAGLEDSASAAAVAAPGRRSTSAIRSLFSRPFAAGNAAPSCSGAAPPDLRRSKSFSCGRGGDALAAADEPQRWSCDVRGRSTLWALFHQDDRERVRDGTAFAAFPASSSAAAAALPFQVQQHPPPSLPELFLEEEIVMAESCDEITPVAVEPIVLPHRSGGMETEAYATGEVKPMKDHIDLETSQPKKPPPMDLKEIAGSFWVAASVFSKKWQKWRRKQKLKKEEAAGSKAAAAAMPPASKPSFLRRSRLRGEAGCSEFAGGRRRSCDTDPRFSFDGARMSVDDAGVSWDGPRASWDGYLFGAGAGIGLGRAPPPPSRLPPILSALEDSPAGVVERSDGQIPVEQHGSQPEPEGGANTPGGTAQTRDYYMDTSSRRRRSLDRSSSSRRRSFEVPEPKPAPLLATAIAANARESPLIGSSEFHHFHHAEDLLDHRFSCSSLMKDFPASLDTAFPDPGKKPRGLRKAWSLWGFIHRRATGRRNGEVADDRAFSEAWPVRGHSAPRTTMMQRCDSNASARSSFSSNSGGGMGSSRRCFVDGGGVGVIKRPLQEEQCGVLERNRSARSSPAHHADNGMLRFYLTPLRSASGRRAPGTGIPASGGRHLRSPSFARSMLRLY